MVLLSFCLIFYQFQPVVAYKSVAYKKKLVSQPQQSQFPVCNLHSETYSQPSPASKMELFVKGVSCFQPLTSFVKTCILNV